MKKVCHYFLVFLVALFFIGQPSLVMANTAYISYGGSEYEPGTFRTELGVGDRGQIRRPKDSPLKDSLYSFHIMVRDPSILSFDEQGNWVALKPGKTEVVFGFPSGDTPQSKKFDEELKRYKVDLTVAEIAAIAQVTVSGIDSGANTDIYRIYNPNNREHLYTISENERDSLVARGWGTYEGVAFQSLATGKAVHRLYNPILRDHHYTTDQHEITILMANHHWIDEGVQWYTGGNKPVYRLFHPGLTTGSHHYTADEHEVAILTTRGWLAEGIAWHTP